jgi:hypothetical protein
MVAWKKNREDDFKKINFENVKIEREKSGEKRRADIWVSNRTFSCVIENKIDSPEAEDQTVELYSDFSNRAPVEFFVFLTPKNIEPKSESFKPSISYYEIRDILKKINASGHTKFIIDEYVKNLEVELLVQEEFDKRTELYFKYYKQIEEVRETWIKDRDNFYNTLVDKLTKQAWYNQKIWGVGIQGSWAWVHKKFWGDEVYIKFWVEPKDGKDKALYLAIYAENFPGRVKFKEEFSKQIEQLGSKISGFEKVLSDATLIERYLPFEPKWTEMLDAIVLGISEMINIFADIIDAAIKVSNK